MTCRCSSTAEHYQRAQENDAQARRDELDRVKAEVKALTPDKKAYEIEQLERVGEHLILRVRYPNCARCAYEGNKIMVFLDVPEAQALKWREIDPHFRDPAKPIVRTEAPSPAARFPASAEGWDDALAYAHTKRRAVKRG